MTFGLLLWRGLRHYWPTHLAVVLGVAIAVSVLAGALVVGESVQASLRALALARLGRVEAVVFGSPTFREALAMEVATQPALARTGAAVAPALVLEAVAEHETSGRRAGRVDVYGVDDRFFALQALSDVRLRGTRDALVSTALGDDLRAAAGDGIVLTFDPPAAIPSGLLQGRREGTARTVRVTVREVLPPSGLGEFALRPHQGAVRCVFVPLRLLQRTLALERSVNALLVSGPGASATGGDGGPRGQASRGGAGALGVALPAAYALDDVGVHVRVVDEPATVVVESETGYLSGPLEQIVTSVIESHVGVEAVPALTYLANAIRIGDRAIPYSAVTAIDLARYGSAQEVTAAAPAGASNEAIWLNEWALRDLRASAGDQVTLEYFVWSDAQGLATRAARFTLAGSVRMDGPGGDRTLTPDYPGLTDELRMSEWDPPFPVDLSRVRPEDEAYWDRYRAAPKAFVPLGTGQRLWSSRYGRATSVRAVPPAGSDGAGLAASIGARLRSAIDPVALGVLAIVPVRAESLRAAAGTTDFGEYFAYFSFFLVASGLLLAGLFFRLGVEQRVREIGLLRAVGVAERTIRRLFLAEGTVLAAAGAVLGVAGALGYSALVMVGLRTWWVDAVGTTRLALEPRAGTLAAGALAAVAIAPLVIAVTLRGLVTASPRGLLAGEIIVTGTAPHARAFAPHVRTALPAGLAAAGAATVALGLAGVLGRVPAFFTAGGALLLASLLALSARWRRPPAATIGAGGRWPVARLGARGASHRPNRAVLSVALVAFATFTIVAVGAFRRGGPEEVSQRASGTGGYALIGESVLPLHHDVGSAAGRASLGVPASVAEVLEGLPIARFRLRTGDDASCLNLYRPTRPRLLGAPADFMAQGRFAFAKSIAASDEERRNPWLLLRRQFDDGAVPAIGDANSLGYVFHAGVGDEVVVPREGADPIRLRIVAALADSVLQSELIVAEERFTSLFAEEGYRVFLVDTGGRDPGTIAEALETGLADYGLDVASTADRLATYHRVENTYLTTFQTLGGLGLLLGTLGIGVVLFRNVLERRRELALLRAVGFGDRAISRLVVAEAGLLVGLGVIVGTSCALLAVAPAILERRGVLPAGWLTLLIAGVLVTGVSASAVAARAARRFALVSSLRTE